MQWRAKQDAVILTLRERRLVEKAIVEVCERRRYLLHAVNARTNHVHAVVSAQKPPERIADSFKAYSTGKLRKAGFRTGRVWSRGKSRPYLWKPRDVERAIEYVLYGQGDRPFELEE